MSSVEQEIPSYYICPITKQIMRQPMMTRWGVCFERHAVIQWLERGRGFCPVTKKARSPRDLVPNTKLQKQINAWRSKHNARQNPDIVDPSEHDEVDQKTEFCYMALSSPQAKRLGVRQLFTSAA